jgi:glycosyltransferase involved in cell wall biosynthesis
MRTERGNRLRVAHVISGLEVGGAEMALVGLIRSSAPALHAEVFSMTRGGPLADRLRGTGVPVHELGMRRGLPDPRALWSLARKLRRTRPDVVQTWMYHADLFGGLAAVAAGIPAVWGLHHTSLDGGGGKAGTSALVRLNAILSHCVPRRIVACADSAARLHADLGYAASRIVVIHNGFDVERFRPEARRRSEVRFELGVPEDAPLVGMVARFHPQKDHRTFVEAAVRVRRELPATCLVLCGSGVDEANTQLTGWLAAAGLKPFTSLLGTYADMPGLYSSLDVLCLSSSHGEAFPMVIGEAMACGVPCIATDVGDTALLIGETGRIVPPRDPDRLGLAVLDILRLSPTERQALGRSARRRIESDFRLEKMAEQYTALYREIAAPPR